MKVTVKILISFVSLFVLMSFSCGCKNPPLPVVEVEEASPHPAYMMEVLELGWGQGDYKVGAISEEARETVKAHQMEVGPAGYSIDTEGSIYIDDVMNHRYIKYDSNGKFVGAVGHERFNDAPYVTTGPGYLYVYDSDSVIYRYRFEDDSIEEMRFSNIKSSWSLYMGSVGTDTLGNVYLLGRDWNRARATNSPKILCVIDPTFKEFKEERELPIEDWQPIYKIDDQGNLYYKKTDEDNKKRGVFYRIDPQNNISEFFSFDLSTNPPVGVSDKGKVFIVISGEYPDNEYYYLSDVGEVLEVVKTSLPLANFSPDNELYFRMNRTIDTDDESPFRIYRVDVSWEQTVQ